MGPPGLGVTECGPRGHGEPSHVAALPRVTVPLRRNVRQKVQLAIAQAFGISASSLHLTKPTFFSRINSTAARTVHDEYWHAHVDKVRPGLCSPREWVRLL